MLPVPPSVATRSSPVLGEPWFLQAVGRKFFAQERRDGNALHRFSLNATADAGRSPAANQVMISGGIGARDVKAVGGAFIPKLQDSHLDVKHILEFGSTVEIAFHVDARPTDGRGAIGIGHHNAQTCLPKQGVFGLLHVDDQGSEVDNPCRVGVAELDAPLRVESWHYSAT
jgi:hypothetical protein